MEQPDREATDNAVTSAVLIYAAAASFIPYTCATTGRVPDDLHDAVVVPRVRGPRRSRSIYMTHPVARGGHRSCASPPLYTHPFCVANNTPPFRPRHR